MICKRNIQFTTSDHVADHQYMTMATDSKKYAGNCEEGEHLLSCLRACILLSINACVKTFSKFVVLNEVEPCNFVTIEIRLVDIFRGIDGRWRVIQIGDNRSARSDRKWALGSM
jgi:hypothetical protein